MFLIKKNNYIAQQMENSKHKEMKNILLVLSVFAFINCSNDDDVYPNWFDQQIYDNVINNLGITGLTPCEESEIAISQLTELLNEGKFKEEEFGKYNTMVIAYKDIQEQYNCSN